MPSLFLLQAIPGGAYPGAEELQGAWLRARAAGVGQTARGCETPPKGRTLAIKRSRRSHSLRRCGFAKPDAGCADPCGSCFWLRGEYREYCLLIIYRYLPLLTKLGPHRRPAPLHRQGDSLHFKIISNGALAMPLFAPHAGAWIEPFRAGTVSNTSPAATRRH